MPEIQVAQIRACRREVNRFGTRGPPISVAPDFAEPAFPLQRMGNDFIQVGMGRLPRQSGPNARGIGNK